jgi:hypothetical protein
MSVTNTNKQTIVCMEKIIMYRENKTTIDNKMKYLRRNIRKILNW